MVVVYLDIDGPLADFKRGVGRLNPGPNPPEMMQRGFFRNLPLQQGAKEAVDLLLQHKDIDLYIATKPDFHNLWSATEKCQWIQEHFPALLNKMFLTCDKGHLNGHFLVDDDERWKPKFEGEFLHFDEDKPIESWAAVLRKLQHYR